MAEVPNTDLEKVIYGAHLGIETYEVAVITRKTMSLNIFHYGEVTFLAEEEVLLRLQKIVEDKVINGRFKNFMQDIKTRPTPHYINCPIPVFFQQILMENNLLDVVLYEQEFSHVHNFCIESRKNPYRAYWDKLYYLDGSESFADYSAWIDRFNLKIHGYDPRTNNLYKYWDKYIDDILHSPN